MLEFSFPGEVLLYHGLALVAVWIQFAPVIWLVVDLPVWRQLGPEKHNALFGCERLYFKVWWTDNLNWLSDERLFSRKYLDHHSVHWNAENESCAVYDKFYIKHLLKHHPSTAAETPINLHHPVLKFQLFDIVCAHSMNQPFTHWHRDDWDEYGLRFLYPREIKTLCHDWTLPLPNDRGLSTKPEIKLTPRSSSKCFIKTWMTAQTILSKNRQ